MFFGWLTEPQLFQRQPEPKYRQSTFTLLLPERADCFLTDPTTQTYFAVQRLTSIAFFVEQTQPGFLCKFRSNSCGQSISRPQTRSAFRYRKHCRLLPTR